MKYKLTLSLRPLWHILFFPANTPVTSHLKHPLFQSLNRFTGIRFVCTKRNKEYFFSGGSHNTHPAAVHARVWTPVRTRLSMPWDGAITVRPMLAGRQRRLTGHKYLRNKLSYRDVSSCRFILWRKGLSPLHAVRGINASGSGRRGWEGVRVHIGPHWAEGVGRAPPGHQEITSVILCRLILNDIIIHIKMFNDIILFYKIVWHCYVINFRDYVI